MTDAERELLREIYEHIKWRDIPIDVLERLKATFAQSNAAPEVDSRSRLRRLARQKGELIPEWSAAPDSGEGWISVNERLPEPGVIVLIANNKHRAVASRDFKYNWWNPDGLGGYEWEWEFDPTHWTPLPAPPTDKL